MDIQKNEAFEAHFKSTQIYCRECTIRGKDILEFSKTMGGYFNIVANDAWNMWLEAKAQAVPEGFVLVEKTKLMQIVGSAAIIEPITRGNPLMSKYKTELDFILSTVRAVIDAQEQK